MSLSSNIGSIVGERDMGRSCSGTNGSAGRKTTSLSDGNEGGWETGVTEWLPSAVVSTD
jgi:hypothetical protein